MPYRFTYFPIRYFIIGITTVVLPILACSEAHRQIQPTELAPAALSGQDFSFKNINNYDFSSKNLQNINFEGARIVDSNFTDADLKGANITSAYIGGSNFTGADLTGATLNWTCLSDSIWTNAKLDDKWESVIDLLSNGIQSGQDLTSYDLSYTCFNQLNMESVNLEGVNARESSWFAVNLSNANLSGINFQNANLEQSILRGANLTDANLVNTDFSYATLTRAVVTQDQLGAAILKCTRMPDGTLGGEEHCLTTPPPN